MSSASYDNSSGQWKFNACVIWQNSGAERIQFLSDSPEIFSRFEDAEGAGVEYAKNWVDNKVKEVV